MDKETKLEFDKITVGNLKEIFDALVESSPLGEETPFEFRFIQNSKKHPDNGTTISDKLELVPKTVELGYEKAEDSDTKVFLKASMNFHSPFENPMEALTILFEYMQLQDNKQLDLFTLDEDSFNEN